MMASLRLKQTYPVANPLSVPRFYDFREKSKKKATLPEECRFYGYIQPQLNNTSFKGGEGMGVTIHPLTAQF
jgi:hypothetical protein